MQITAQWWMEDRFPVIEVDLGGTKVNLTRREGDILVAELQGCLNGIVVEIARYFIVSGWGKKDHLALKEGFTEKAAALCGTKPRAWTTVPEDAHWHSDRPLRSVPDRQYVCARCIAKYEKLEAASA